MARKGTRLQAKASARPKTLEQVKITGEKQMSARKRSLLRKAAKYVCPNKVEQWSADGIPLVMGKREGYFIWDFDGRRLIDLHINGGTFSLGHRNAECIRALEKALKRYDIGNHHFPSVARTELAEMYAKTSPGDLQYTIFGSGGGEAGDIAIKTARHATQRLKVVSIIKGYHGHTGLVVKAGDTRFSELFLSEDRHGEFKQVPFNDLAAMEEALKKRDVACVILETIPATYGFRMPAEGYLQGVRNLCTKFGTLYIADEVQTGLARTGKLWGVQSYGVNPDILISAKGTGGGIYPIAATLVSKNYAGWLGIDGWGHVSTFGGSEVGCEVAKKVLEISSRPATLKNVRERAKQLRAGLEDIQTRYPFFSGIRQKGLVMGLEFDAPEGAKQMMSALYESGIWAIYSAYDLSVLQFKPGVLMTRELADEVLERFEKGLKKCVKSL